MVAPVASPARGRALRRRLVSVALALLLVAAGSRAAAQSTPGGDPPIGRGSWAALLLGYVGLSAVMVGGAHLWRDNIVGRSFALGAASIGGATVGAIAGQWLGGLGCSDLPTDDCTVRRGSAVLAGG